MSEPRASESGDSAQGVAFVTGASRGIGKATALALARAGFDVAVGARTVREGEGRDDSGRAGAGPLPGSLETTAAAVEAEGVRALPVTMDLLDRASLAAAVARVLGEWGRVDVHVNNAVHTGRGSMSRFEDTTIEMVGAKLEANAVAPLFLVKLVLPGMLDRGRGTIVDITSHVATNDPPAPAGEGGWGLAYAMSKGAFHRLAGFVAVEYGHRGIRAFNLDPGFVVTERMETAQAAIGLGDYRGAPPSVPAAVAAWLCSGAPDSDMANGSTVLAQKTALERGLHADWRARSSRSTSLLSWRPHTRRCSRWSCSAAWSATRLPSPISPTRWRRAT